MFNKILYLKSSSKFYYRLSVYKQIKTWYRVNVNKIKWIYYWHIIEAFNIYRFNVVVKCSESLCLITHCLGHYTITIYLYIKYRTKFIFIIVYILCFISYFPLKNETSNIKRNLCVSVCVCCWPTPLKKLNAFP